MARHEAVVSQVVPTSGVLPANNLRSLDNWRAFFHNAVGVIVPILVTLHITTNDVVTAWLPFVFAIADNILSVGNTTDRVRKAIYAGVGALQAGGLVTMIVTSVAPEWVPVTGAIMAVATSFLARFYTPTTTVVPKGINMNNVA
jgi:hypothetical protein